MKRSEVKKVSTTISRTIYAATLGLFLGWLCIGYGKSAQESSAPVPPDCQQFLVKYFEAFKAKDVVTIYNLSSAFFAFSNDKGMPQTNMDKTHEMQKKMIADNYKSVTDKFGDFKSYTVSNVKVTKISPQDRPSYVYKVGIHAEIDCKTEFSKQSPVQINLHLFKETEGSEYSLLLWKVQADAL